MLSQDSRISAVTEFNDAEHLYLTLANGIKPDIIIIDLLLGKIKGTDVMKKCLQDFNPSLNFIVLSGLTDTQTIREALKVGAKGYLSKEIAMEELFEAIEFVTKENKVYISKHLRDSMLNDYLDTKKEKVELTEKEITIIKMICESRSPKEIAAEMSLSLHTIHYYQKSISKKLKIHSTAELIIYAIKNKIYQI